MDTLAKKYLDTAIQLLSRIKDEETDVIEQAAKLIADAIEHRINSTYNSGRA